ncbi:hypothetical protein ABNG04_17255 [Halorubrum sp. RMP-11]
MIDAGMIEESAADERLSAGIDDTDEIAAEQGSASADVVLQNYLSDSRARTLCRKYMRDQLAAAFEPSEM